MITIQIMLMWGYHMKKEIKYFVFIVIIITVALMGCSNKKGLNSEVAKCKIYLEDLPEEYELLSKEIRDEIKISVSLRSNSSDKNYKVELTEEENYVQEIPLVPGTYDVWCSINNKSLSMLDVNTNVKEIKINKDEEAEVPISITNRSEFSEAMVNNVTDEEIMSTSIFARKVRYGSKVIDLNNIKQEMKFVPKDSKSLAMGEIGYIPSDSGNGISIVVQNQTNSFLNIEKCTFVGVKFSKNNIIFPMGITLGMDISKISHAETGLLGTPDYFEGTPLIGFGYDESKAIYIDDLSGDRISFTIRPDDSYISAITYEFEKYE